jgi:competence protein ComEC
VRLPKGVRYWLIGGILIFYSLATGWHEATVRATVMFLIAEAAFFIRRSKDPLSAWAVAGSGWLLFYPWALTTPGFQFSYLVTLGLILFVSGLHSAGEEHPFRVWEGLKVSVVATLASEPLAAWWFGKVTLFALVANVLIGTATSFLLVLAPIALSLMDIWSAGSQWLAKELVAPTLNYVRWVLEKVAFAPSSVVEIGSVSTLFLALYYGCALAMWREPSRPRLPQEPKSVQNK